MPSSRPIAISDRAMSRLLELAQPLAPPDRGQFLQDIAAELRGRGDLGDGLVVRVAREVQRRYLRLPEPVELRRVSQSRIAGLGGKAKGNGGV
jgi:hypothetical protein